MKFYLKNSLALIFILLIISCNKDVVLKPTNTFLEDDQNQVSVPIPLGAKELLSIIKKEVGDIKDPKTYLLNNSSFGGDSRPKSNYLHLNKTDLIFTY